MSVVTAATRWLPGVAMAALLAGCATPGASPGLPSAAGASSTPTLGPSPGPTAPPAPTPTASSRPSTPATGVAAFDAAARAFVERFNADWADAPAAFAAFTPEAVIIDPSNADFTIGPGQDLVTSWAGFAQDVPAYRAATTAAYVADTVGAFATEVAGLPVNTPDGLARELRVFRFTDGTASRATAMELWYDVGERMADTENTRADCVPPDRCVDDAGAFATAYLEAWTSGDPERIAGLYRGDATYADGARGMRARGPAEIAALAQSRFGGGAAACSVRDVYVQTDDGDPRTSDNTDPRGGTVAGIAIGYRCEPGPSAGGQPLDGMTLLLFGTRQAGSFDNDPDGLIASEEVAYDAADLVAAGLAP